jgi:hypothetical protein
MENPSGDLLQSNKEVSLSSKLIVVLENLSSIFVAVIFLSRPHIPDYQLPIMSCRTHYPRVERVGFYHIRFIRMIFEDSNKFSVSCIPDFYHVKTSESSAFQLSIGTLGLRFASTTATGASLKQYEMNS